MFLIFILFSCIAVLIWLILVLLVILAKAAFPMFFKFNSFNFSWHTDLDSWIQKRIFSANAVNYTGKCFRLVTQITFELFIQRTGLFSGFKLHLFVLCTHKCQKSCSQELFVRESDYIGRVVCFCMQPVKTTQ